MKFLMVDDEHELYRVMMADLFCQDQYEVEEVSRMKLPAKYRRIYEKHYTARIDLPFKEIWDRFYALHMYPFDPDETYIVLFMNGTFRQHYHRRYLENLKKQHPNVKLALLLFDHSSYYSAKRCMQFRDVFDYAFSFDDGDCRKYHMEKFYTCFSVPDYVTADEAKRSAVFFAGSCQGRLELLMGVLRKIAGVIDNCKFFVTEIPDTSQESIPGVTYNQRISFREENQMSYNTDCIVEVMKENQKGITLRTCEAVLYNKKLLTNNPEIKKMPFYDPRYISVFTNAEDIDVDFLKRPLDVQYRYRGEFSPVRILDRIAELERQAAAT